MPLADLQSLLARALMDRSFRETVLQCTPADAPPEWKQIAGIPATELHRIAYYTLGLRAVTLQRILPKTWQFLPPRFSPVWMERYMAKHPSTTTDGLSGLSEVRRFVEFLSSCHERGEISSAALNSARRPRLRAVGECQLLGDGPAYRGYDSGIAQGTSTSPEPACESPAARW
jgi:hypothetical protein